MANDKIIQEISQFLDRNFIFDPSFKLEIKSRLGELTAIKLVELRKIIKEANDYQRERLAKKISEDKTVVRRLLAEKKKYDAAIKEIYEKKMRTHDKNKIGALLTRIKHL
jgi:ribosome-binding protein aMBF1 (putative translation factor)